MSLLDDGPETVIVFPAEEHVDAYGQRVLVASATGVRIEHAQVQPIVPLQNRAGLSGHIREDDLQGQSAPPRYRLIVRDAPLSASAQVSWRGERYDVIGAPAQCPNPPNLVHITAIIQRR